MMIKANTFSLKMPYLGMHVPHGYCFWFAIVACLTRIKENFTKFMFRKTLSKVLSLNAYFSNKANI